MKVDELYHPDDWKLITAEIMLNLSEVAIRMTKFEDLYQEKLIPTNGFRTLDRHKKIYADINERRRKQGLDPQPIPLGSKHLRGLAVDCYDPEPAKKLRLWLALHPDSLDECDLWCEKFDEEPRVHFQVVKYGSYKPGDSRFFRAF